MTPKPKSLLTLLALCAVAYSALACGDEAASALTPFQPSPTPQISTLEGLVPPTPVPIDEVSAMVRELLGLEAERPVPAGLLENATEDSRDEVVDLWREYLVNSRVIPDSRLWVWDICEDGTGKMIGHNGIEILDGSESMTWNLRTYQRSTPDQVLFEVQFDDPSILSVNPNNTFFYVLTVEDGRPIQGPARRVHESLAVADGADC